MCYQVSQRSLRFYFGRHSFLFDSDVADVFSAIHKLFIVVLSNSSALHLMMVVGEKVIAIKYSFRYPYIVTTRNIKIGVLFCWVYSSSLGIILQMMGGRSALYYLWVSHILFVCVVFVSCAYMFLYFESRRHQKMIKAQQLPQEQVKTFLKESKAVKTTYLWSVLLDCVCCQQLSTLVSELLDFFRPEFIF